MALFEMAQITRKKVSLPHFKIPPESRRKWPSLNQHRPFISRNLNPNHEKRFFSNQRGNILLEYKEQQLSIGYFVCQAFPPTSREKPKFHARRRDRKASKKARNVESDDRYPRHAGPRVKSMPVGAAEGRSPYCDSWEIKRDPVSAIRFISFIEIMLSKDSTLGTIRSEDIE